jgi:hypothetical protein
VLGDAVHGDHRSPDVRMAHIGLNVRERQTCTSGVPRSGANRGRQVFDFACLQCSEKGAAPSPRSTRRPALAAQEFVQRAATWSIIGTARGASGLGRVFVAVGEPSAPRRVARSSLICIGSTRIIRWAGRDRPTRKVQPALAVVRCSAVGARSVGVAALNTRSAHLALVGATSPRPARTARH